MKFKVGDRVAVYTLLYDRSVGEVVSIREGYLLDIKTDKHGRIYGAHVKHCRKLQPKVFRLRLYARIPSYSTTFVSASFDEERAKATAGLSSVVEFVEVKRKK